MSAKSHHESEEYAPVVVVSTKQSWESAMGSIHSGHGKSINDNKSPRLMITKSVLEGGHYKPSAEAHGFLGKGLKRVASRTGSGAGMSRSMIES